MRSTERVQPGSSAPAGKSHIKTVIFVLVVAVVGAMIASIGLYIDGAATRRVSIDGPSASSGTTVTLDIESVQANYSVLLGNMKIIPGSALLDPATDSLKQDLRVEVTSVATPVTRTWSKGMLPGLFPVPLTLARDVERWPFDRYYTGPITVELFAGGAQTPERARLMIIDRIPGWKVYASGPNKAQPLAPYEVELKRSASTMVFAVIILCILLTIAGQAVFVAVQTVRGRRRFQSPMTAWYAAMVFAVVPLRNSLPGSPAFGSWIDMTIVLWVLVALVVSMLLYIVAWWRQLRPAPHGEAPERHQLTDRAL